MHGEAARIFIVGDCDHLGVARTAMVVLICTLEPYRIAWLPQFVQHYRSIGVERFLLALQLEPGAEQGAKDRDYTLFQQTAAALGIDETFRWENEFSAPAIIRHQRTLQAERLRPDDWAVWCDSDEFQVYPAPLPEIIAQCDALDIDFVRGALIDRVAADYSLPPFDPQTPSWDAFPRICNVTLALGAGDPRKVVLARAGVLLSGGKHFTRGHHNAKTFSGWVQVHHFKWDATLLERLRYRVRPEWRARFPWWVESQRLLDYFAAHDSRFDPADLTPIALTGSHFIALDVRNAATR